MFLKHCSAVITLMSLYCGSVIAQPDASKQIQQYVMAQAPAQLAFLKQLVLINSGTTNVKGVKQVGDLLQAEFEKLGFKTAWIAEPPAMHRAPTLVATREGARGKRLLLIGHLDTVFAQNSDFKTLKQDGNRLTGPGVADDKGGDVVILYALKALQSIQALDNVSIKVILTGDEEDSGKPSSISRKPLIDAAKQSDIALEFESASDLHLATVARRGITDWTITTYGHTGHSSDIFTKGIGDGAILEIARILEAMRIALSDKKDLSFSPGLILGGTAIDVDANQSGGSARGKTNVIAATAIAKGEFRYLTLQQKQDAEQIMQRIVTNNLPVTFAKLHFQDGIPAMSATANNQALLKQYSQISQALGYGAVNAVDPDLRGASDISYVAPWVAANLAGLGPVGVYLHSPEETLFVGSLPIATLRAALLIQALTADGLT